VRSQVRTRIVRTRIRGVGLALALSGLVALTGCTSAVPVDPPATAGSSEAAPPASSAPVPVAYSPDGSAEENLPVFEQVLRAQAGADPEVAGSTVVDALAAAGFPREALQVTADETSVGLDAPSVQVSAKVGGACLLGQYGPKSGGVRAVVSAPLATGACLVGRTAPVDG
jgi:hypothetical protein